VPSEVQHDAPGGAALPAGADIALDQGGGERLDGVAIDRVLQPGQGRLAGQFGARERSAATDELQQRVRAQRGGVVLVGVATGDLVEALAEQGSERVAHGPAAPLGDAGGERVHQAEGLIRLRQPGQAAIAGQPARVEGRL